MRKVILISIFFIAIGIILILLYHFIFPTFYVKGVILLQKGEVKTLSIPYSSFLFEYKDNISLPINVTFQSVQILGSKYSSQIYSFYGNSFEGDIIIKNNATSPVLFGYVIVDYSPLVVFFPVLLYLGIALIIIGIAIAGITYYLYH